MPHICSSVPIDSQEIRLLTVLPGEYGDPLRSRLGATALLNSRSYEALSYVWGNPQITDRMYVNGKEHSVTQNLSQGLRHIRLPDRERVLWVDAICIDQDDVNERTGQVRMMDRIYGQATRTIIWLGLFGEAGDRAMDLIHRIAHNGAAEAFEPSFADARNALSVVLQCEWWQRVWVIQELALSRGEPILQCGHSSLPWSDFTAFWTATTSLKFREASSDPRETAKWQAFAASIPQLQLIRNWEAWQRSWARLILLTSHYNATDPRDRIIALHGMLPPDERSLWSPDYSSSTAEVFATLTRVLIKSPLGLSFICYDKPRTRGDLPSWVPDFSSHCSVTDVNGFDFLPEEVVQRVDEGFEPNISFSKDGLTLVAEGICFDAVSVTVPPGKTIGMKQVFERSTALYSKAKGRQNASSPFFKYIDRSQHLAEILGCKRKGFQASFSSKLDELLTSTVPFDFLGKNGASIGSREAEMLPMLDFMFHAVKRHSFFMTASGFAGMGPSTMTSGDTVVILFGCAAPMLIRKTAHDDPTCRRGWQLVGSCCIPAIANGQVRAACIGEDDTFLPALQTFEIH